MKIHVKRNQNGFTFLEVLLTMAVFSILLGIVSLNLLNIQRKTSINTTIDVLISDLKRQQTKAMAGDTEGRSSPDNYGVYFDTDSYTLFHGISYSSSDIYNFTVNLDGGLNNANILFPSSQIIFEIGSGEIVNFSPGQDSITIRNTSSGEQKTIRINRYGAITDIN